MFGLCENNKIEINATKSEVWNALVNHEKTKIYMAANSLNVTYVVTENTRIRTQEVALGDYSTVADCERHYTQSSINGEG